MWDKAGFDIPGLSKTDRKALVDFIDGNESYRSFAGTLSLISKQEDGYIEPSEYWNAENINSDIQNLTNEIGRAKFLEEWKQNKEIIFSEENMN